MMPKQITAKPGEPLLSPLRYPGSKRRLVQYLQATLELNDLHPLLLVVPFAGGASAALQLLCDGIVDRIGLADVDPLITSFWLCVFFDTDWLVSAVDEIEVTLPRWEAFRKLKPATTRDRALKCLFLNRTSFSGILAPSGGPIGGCKQLSAYDITCRFPRHTLTKRIRQAASLRDRVAFVKECGWQECLQSLTTYRQVLGNEIFVYLDPPFYYKADKLYTYYFTEADHKALHRVLGSLTLPWLLSYDPAEPIELLYSSNGTKPARVEMLYSAAEAPGFVPRQELIITNLRSLPRETRSWRMGRF